MASGFYKAFASATMEESTELICYQPFHPFNRNLVLALESSQEGGMKLFRANGKSRIGGRLACLAHDDWAAGMISEQVPCLVNKLRQPDIPQLGGELPLLPLLREFTYKGEAITLPFAQSKE